MQKPVQVVSDPDVIRLLADYRHQEMLQLLSERPMTESQMSKKIGLTRAAIGYHLNPLLKANLIYLKKVEAEHHGILQKFYSPIAAVFAVEYDNIPGDIARFFVQMQIEHLRGVFSALQLHQRFTGISPEKLEALATAMIKQLEHTCREYDGEAPVANAETVKIKIYADALAALLRQDEWASLLPEGGDREMSSDPSSSRYNNPVLDRSRSYCLQAD